MDTVITDTKELETVEEILGRHLPKRHMLIPILQQVQESLGYIPEPAMAMVADRLEIPESAVHGVATFYNQFRFTPPGKHHIEVCMGTACHIKGGQVLLDEWERRLGIGPGQVSEDREYSMERVACVGCCAIAPVMIVDRIVHGEASTSKVEGQMLRFELERKREQKEQAETEGGGS